MEEYQRDIIRKNRSNLVHSMVNIDDILDGLSGAGLFTDTMLEEVSVLQTRMAKNRLILDYIVRRGPKAFDSFYNILVKAGDGQAADFLKPDLKEQRLAEWQRRVNAPVSSSISLTSFPYAVPEPLPENWPTNSDQAPVGLPLQLCPSDSFIMEKFYHPENHNAFPMNKPTRGNAIIINNEDYSKSKVNLSNRKGTQKDRDALEKTFMELGFAVQVHDNCTAEQIQKVLAKEAAKDHADHNCLVFVVLSHGNLGNVLGTDGVGVPLMQILDAFDGESCPSLVNKPKLIFIQACQGEKEDGGSLIRLKDSSKEVVKAFESLTVTKSDANREPTYPSKGETFLALATTADYVSWRNELYGTWFIQALVYVLRKYAHTDHLLDLMTWVNQLVSKAQTSGGCKQISEHRSTLTRKLYFFPGLPNPIEWYSNSQPALQQTARLVSTQSQNSLASSMSSSASINSLSQTDNPDEQRVRENFQAQSETSPSEPGMDQTFLKRVTNTPTVCTEDNEKNPVVACS